MKHQELSLDTRPFGTESAPPVIHHRLASVELKRGKQQGCSLELIENLDELDRIEQDWNSLVSPLDPPFATFGWNRAWYRHFESSYDEMLVFVLRRAGRAAAIFPGCRRGDCIHFAAENLSNKVDVIAFDGIDCGDLWEEVSSWVQGNLPDTKFSFSSLTEDSKMREALSGRKEDLQAQWSWREVTTVTAQEIDLAGGSEEYLQTLESRDEAAFRDAIETLGQKLPACKVDVFRGGETRVRDIETAVEFALEHGGTSAAEKFENSSWINWLGEVSKDPDCGWQMATLVNEGEMIAFHCGFARGETFYEYFRCGKASHHEIRPAENLFLLRIDEWEFCDQIRYCEVAMVELPMAAKTREVSHHSIELQPSVSGLTSLRASYGASRELATECETILAR